VNRDILPERTWGAVNSQVPSKIFCGEGPQLAWGEESAKRSGRVCAAPQGESFLDASMMADLIVSKKGDRVPAQTSPPQPRAPGRKAPAWWSTVAVGGKTWKRALPGWFLVWWRSLCRYSLPQSERLLKGRSGHTRQSGHWRIKAIRMIGRNRKGASGAVALASIGHWWQQRADLGCRAATQLHEGAVGPMAGALRGIPAEWGRERQRLYRWLDGGRDFSPPRSFAVAFKGNRKAETRSVECHFVAS